MNMILFDALPEGNLIPLSDERARHILEVLKLKEGDTFEVKIVGETTKDILDKMNNNWGSFATWI